MHQTVKASVRTRFYVTIGASMEMSAFYTANVENQSPAPPPALVVLSSLICPHVMFLRPPPYPPGLLRQTGQHPRPIQLHRQDLNHRTTSTPWFLVDKALMVISPHLWNSSHQTKHALLKWTSCHMEGMMQPPRCWVQKSSSVEVSMMINNQCFTPPVTVLIWKMPMGFGKRKQGWNIQGTDSASHPLETLFLPVEETV